MTWQEPSSRQVDLLELVDPALDRRMGMWRMETGHLRSLGKADGSGEEIEFPYAPPAEYDWHVSFRCSEGGGSLHFHCQGGGHRFSWRVGGWGNTICGLELIDGKTAEDNVTTHKAARWILAGQTNTASIEVRKGRVRTFLNGEQVGDFPTDFSNLKNDEYSHGKRPDTLAITMTKVPIIIDQSLVVERKGRGRKTR
jgi:hypothetical protein